MLTVDVEWMLNDVECRYHVSLLPASPAVPPSHPRTTLPTLHNAKDEKSLTGVCEKKVRELKTRPPTSPVPPEFNVEAQCHRQCAGLRKKSPILPGTSGDACQH